MDLGTWTTCAGRGEYLLALEPGRVHFDPKLTGVAAILVLGVLGHWVAWRLRVPSILALLGLGFIAGPATGWLDPDALLGPLLVPVVSLAVALVLFEGGLSLRFQDIAGVGDVVRRLLTLGIACTWLLTAGAAHFLLDMSWGMSVLLGAVLCVTGPTVVNPLLRHIRPSGPVGSTLQWEGILVDPAGALLALLVFEALVATPGSWSLWDAAAGVGRTILVAVALGVGVGRGLSWMINRYALPDTLEIPAVLAAVAMVYVLSNAFQEEAGLLSVTLMGIIMANRRWGRVQHLAEFHEPLRDLTVGILFILLCARLDPQRFTALHFGTVLFLLSLFLVVRPAAVALSAAGSTMGWRDRLFLAWMAPRGVVAAAVSSVFALRLDSDEAARLVDITFLVITVTVVVYGLTAGPLARRLGLSDADPQGSIVVGGHPWARKIAAVLQEHGFPVLLVDSNVENVTQARREGLSAHVGSVLSDQLFGRLDLEGLGRLLAITSNDEVNGLACLHFEGLFGKKNVFQLPPRRVMDQRHGRHLLGRVLFGADVTFDWLESRFAGGAVLEAVPGGRVRNEGCPLFLLRSGRLLVFTADPSTLEVRPKDTVLQLRTGEGHGAGEPSPGSTNQVP